MVSTSNRSVIDYFHFQDLSHELLVLPRIHKITIGEFELEPPYTSPLPLELVRKGHLYVCEKCLDFKESKETLERHTVSFLVLNLVVSFKLCKLINLSFFLLVCYHVNI